MSIFSQHSRFNKGFIPLEKKNLRFLPTRKRVGSLTGFTLIELVVVLAIMIFITLAFLVRQQKFDSSTILRSLAYSVALSMRQAQVYGTSVRESAQGSANFAPAYGVYLSSGSKTGYILFADTNGNNAYDADENLQSFTLNNGYTISNVCAINGSAMSCSAAACPATLPAGVSTCTPGLLGWLTVLFKRPNPDAFISTDIAGSYSSAFVQIAGPGGDTRSITVSLTGQIAVGSAGS